MADAQEKQGGHIAPEPGRSGTKPGKIVEQDPKDIPEKSQSQVPDVNPHTVQPGHRDREEV